MRGIGVRSPGRGGNALRGVVEEKERGEGEGANVEEGGERNNEKEKGREKRREQTGQGGGEAHRGVGVRELGQHCFLCLRARRPS